MVIDPKPKENSISDLSTIMKAIKSEIGTAVQTALAPYAEKIITLERASMWNSRGNMEPRHSVRECPSPKGIEMSMWAPTNHTQYTNTEDDNFTLVTRNKRGKKAKNKINTNTPFLVPAPQEKPALASYISAAAATATTKQPPPPAQPTRVLTITEITVLQDGGFLDKNLEQTVTARAADAIVCEVTLKMAKMVAKPVPLKAGHWSIHSCSKGNFIHSFDGNVPFDIIATYEHILLAPF